MDSLMSWVGIALIVIIVFFAGALTGAETYEDILRDEIEEYNSIRLDGVYYYPEGSGEHDK